MATSPSLWWHEAHNEPLPKVGDLNIVTNWQGEGDKSLAYWKRIHWAYHHRELEDTSFTPAKICPLYAKLLRWFLGTTHVSK